MKSLTKLGLCLVAIAMSAAATSAHATDRNFFAVLTADQEVPVVLSDGAGLFRARLNRDGSIDFALRVKNLTGAFGAAHIHFGQRNVNGGVMVTLCGGPAPAAVPACSDEVTGTITADTVGGAAQAQGINAGDLDAVIKALRSGDTYINVHTSAFPSGEIRGQVR